MSSRRAGRLHSLFARCEQLASLFCTKGCWEGARGAERHMKGGAWVLGEGGRK